MTTTDYIDLQESTIRLGEHAIARPCKRESVLHEALVLLPDSAPREMGGYARAMKACAKLTALEQAKADAEKELSSAMAALRAEVGRSWKKSEIPAETLDLLSVW